MTTTKPKPESGELAETNIYRIGMIEKLRAEVEELRGELNETRSILSGKTLSYSDDKLIAENDRLRAKLKEVEKERHDFGVYVREVLEEHNKLLSKLDDAPICPGEDKVELSADEDKSTQHETRPVSYQKSNLPDEKWATQTPYGCSPDEA